MCLYYVCFEPLWRLIQLIYIINISECSSDYVFPQKNMDVCIIVSKSCYYLGYFNILRMFAFYL